MRLTDVGEIIAVRKIFISGSVNKEISVVFGKPKIYPNTSDYYCPVQIKGIESERVEYAVGIDSVQALQLAFKWAGATLIRLNKKMGGSLMWEGGSDFGFY